MLPQSAVSFSPVSSSHCRLKLNLESIWWALWWQWSLWWKLPGKRGGNDASKDKWNDNNLNYTVEKMVIDDDGRFYKWRRWRWRSLCRSPRIWGGEKSSRAACAQPMQQKQGDLEIRFRINIIKFLKNTIQIDFCLISRYLWVSEGESSPLPQTVPK